MFSASPKRPKIKETVTEQKIGVQQRRHATKQKLLQKEHSKQRNPVEVSCTSAIDNKSLNSFGGSSLDEVFANFPIEDDDQQLISFSPHWPRQSAPSKAETVLNNAEDVLDVDLVDELFKDPPAATNRDNFLSSQSCSGTGVNEEKKGKEEEGFGPQ